ncbi:MAG: hypothetical protein R2710_02830 [Acidimicrobiales bacterium]
MLIERTINDGVLDPAGIDPGAVVRAGSVMAVIVVAAALISWATQRRLARSGRGRHRHAAHCGVRQGAPASIADHNETKRRVRRCSRHRRRRGAVATAQWGLCRTIHPTVILGTFAVLAYARRCWRRSERRLSPGAADHAVARQVASSPSTTCYDHDRDMLSSFSEAVAGAAVVPGYGAEARRGVDLDVPRRIAARSIGPGSTLNTFMAAVRRR